MPHPNLPSTLLFSLYEDAVYKRFQTLKHFPLIRRSQIGKLPSASEYADFLEWKEEQQATMRVVPSSTVRVGMGMATIETALPRPVNAGVSPRKKMKLKRRASGFERASAGVGGDEVAGAGEEDGVAVKDFAKENLLDDDERHGEEETDATSYDVKTDDAEALIPSLGDDEAFPELSRSAPDAADSFTDADAIDPLSGISEPPSSHRAVQAPDSSSPLQIPTCGCGHVIHPCYSQIDLKRCPECTMEAHLDFISFICQMWRRLGGPYRPAMDEHDHQEYMGLMQAHRWARTTLANFVHHLEQWDDDEQMWEGEAELPEEAKGGCARALAMWTAKLYILPDQEDPDDEVIGHGDVKELLALQQEEMASGELVQVPRTPSQEDSETDSAAEWTSPNSPEAPNLEEGEVVPETSPGILLFTPVQMLSGNRMSYRRKSVVFSPGTNFAPTRPNHLFARVCETYTPGLNACSGEEGWLNTSFMNDLFYTIGQSRIIHVSGLPNTPLLENNIIDLNSGPDRGDNPHVWRLQLMIDEWFTDLQEQGDQQQYAYQWQVIMQDTDCFFVWREDFGADDAFEHWEACSYDSVFGAANDEEVPEPMGSEGDVDEMEVVEQSYEMDSAEYGEKETYAEFTEEFAEDAGEDWNELPESDVLDD